MRFFSRLNDGRSNAASRKARSASNSLEAKPLSAITGRPGRSAARCGSRSSIADRTSRSSVLGFASAHRTDILVGVQTGNRRSPQKNPEREAQYPYPAQPAMSDRFTVGREWPYSTGVESTILGLSNQKSISTASNRIAFLTGGNAAGSHLFQPGCLGTYGNIGPSRESTNRSERDSEVKPSRAGASASVTSSESGSCGGRPSRRGPDLVVDLHLRCGRQGVQVVRHIAILDALSPFPDAPSAFE